MCVFDHHIRSPGYVFFNATQLTCESSLTRQHSYPMIVPVVISRRCNCDACPSCSGLSQSRPSAPPSSFEGSTRRTAPSLQSAVVANDLKCQCSHGLQPFVTRAETPCTWCRTLIPPGNPAVGCWACGMYSCMECVAVSLETRCASVLNCRGRHGLAKTQIMTGGYACDFCRTVLAGGTTIYICR